MRYLLIVFFLFAGVVVFFGASACRMRDESFGDGQRTEAIKDNVRLSLTSDKRTYHPGQTINISAQVENLAQQPISYTMMNIGDPAIYVYLESSPYAGRRTLYEQNYQSTGLALVTSENLDARTPIARTAIWDQQLHTSPDYIQAPSGVYTITALFFVGEYTGDSSVQAITTTINVNIEGALDLITPDQAQEIALKIPEVQQWWIEHSGPNISKIENGQYYIWFEFGWQQVDPSFTANGLNLEALAKIEPEVYVSIKDKAWEMHFVSNFGSPPNEMHISIDAATGEVLN